MMPRPVLLFLSLFFATSVSVELLSQTRGINKDKYRVSVRETAEEINIDGILDENVWLNAMKTSAFRRVEPTDTGFALAQTEVMLACNSKNLFMAITCLDPSPGKRPVESLRPDFTFYKNDNFLLFMDTFNDQTNGFSFGITPAGSIWDGVQANGGVVNLNWDIKWRSQVKNHDDRWVAEFAIPFRSLRYREGDTIWGINFSRLDLKSNEKSSWAPMPRQFATATLAYAGTLVWDKPLPRSGMMVSFIPYLSFKATQDKLADGNVKLTPAAGADAKIILSTSMNLDITVNPDYSQVEVDRQQTNLDRFELFFPEKRQFYLENSDLFANLGTENLRPFFSRRIGLDNPVIAGARLSGKLGKDLRIGVMDIQTGTRDDAPAANFAVAALQQRVFSRSNITAFFLNKSVTADTSENQTGEMARNSVAGIEFNLASPDNRWTGKAFYHLSVHSALSNPGSSAAANLTYSSQYFTASLNQSFVESAFNSETGYIRRRNYYEINPAFQYKFFTKAGRLVYHGPGAKADLFLKPGGIITDRDIQLSYYFVWSNRNTLTLDARETFIRLQAPFDPTNTGGEMIPAGEKFGWREFGLSYLSDSRRLFNVMLAGRYGGYFNGTRLTVSGELNYRYQPYGSVSVTGSYNRIELPQPYSSANLVLIGPRFDFTFTNRLFFTSFIQYNSQIDNINLNLRFQWRYAPVSDLFIVFTENAFPGDFRVKNRGLIVKISYWFN